MAVFYGCHLYAVFLSFTVNFFCNFISTYSKTSFFLKVVFQVEGQLGKHRFKTSLL